MIRRMRFREVSQVVPSGRQEVSSPFLTNGGELNVPLHHCLASPTVFLSENLLSLKLAQRFLVDWASLGVILLL